MNQPVFAGYQPGVLGRFVALQSEYYARDWGFGAYYEAKIAGAAADFLARMDPARDAVFTAWSPAGEFSGAITVDGSEDDGPLAHLRWFVVAEPARGQGIGKELMRRALAFARESGAGGLYLTTFDGLKPARRVYDGAGFVVTQEAWDSTWGERVKEQRMELRF